MSNIEVRCETCLCELSDDEIVASASIGMSLCDRHYEQITSDDYEDNFVRPIEFSVNF